MRAVIVLYWPFSGGTDISCCYFTRGGSWSDGHSDDLFRSEIR